MPRATLCKFRLDIYCTFVVCAALIVLFMIYWQESEFEIKQQHVASYRSPEINDHQQMSFVEETQKLSEFDKQRLRTSYHCEARYLGCFESDIRSDQGHGVFVTKNVTSMTKELCLSQCSKRSLSGIKSGYVALLEGSVCACARYSRSFIRELSTDACKRSCPGNKNDVCGGKMAASLYRIINPCFKGLHLSEDFVDSRHLACYSSDEDFLETIVFRQGASTTECVLHCGILKNSLAFVDTRGRCGCGKMTKKLFITPKLLECSDLDEEKKIQVYRTLAEDERCSRIKILPPGNYVKIVLTSAPGSGNTWTRFLLESATGYYTGSTYKDGSLDELGYFGEMRLNQTIIIKDHMFRGKSYMRKYDAAILVVRNPYEAAISNFNRHMSHNYTGFADRSAFNSLAFERDLDVHPGVWRNLFQFVIESKKPFLLVFYHNLVENPVAETRRMVKFVSQEAGLKVDDLEDRLLCLSQQTSGRARRKKSKQGFPRDLFTDDMKRNLNAQVTAVREMLEGIGLEKTLPPYEREFFDG